ncbi:MAG: D-alanine--D-alanine ligase [Planctomycetota bacterium]
MATPMKIMVLAGGPDREREVSLQSGRQVADALRSLGHTVYERDVLPDDLSAIDDAQKLNVSAVFPALHGPWGEGGPLQVLLEEAGLPFVGCTQDAARLCMNKWATKQRLADKHLPTAEAELIQPGQKRTLPAPVVIKALDEGSSIGLAICHTEAEAEGACDALFEDHGRLMVERFIAGKELTVGILDDPLNGEPTALPPIQIVPATAFYDYEAKYTREDTRYQFDIDMPAACLDLVVDAAVSAYRALGCRHLARIDFIVDPQFNSYILEANTMPGFTSHSLVPKAAKRMRLDFPALCERLVKLAAG